MTFNENFIPENDSSEVKINMNNHIEFRKHLME